MDNVNAVWYSDPKSKGAWEGLDKAYAKAGFLKGENIQFNGQMMTQLLPGGKGIPGGLGMLRRGYFAAGFKGFTPGQKAFNYVVAHELGHTTRVNAGSANPEANADSFYLRLYERN